MKFILFLKDNIAIAKARKVSLDNVELGVYDGYEEITEKEFNTIELPSKKIDDMWCKTNKFPVIDYPSPEPKPEPTPENGTDLSIDELATAIMEGVNEV